MTTSSKKKIIGVAGTDGSGKDSLAKMLEKKHGWQFVSVTDILREEARRRGIRLGRDTLRQISAEWRREYGLGVLVDRALELYKKDEKNGLVVASLRNPGEADRIHELGGVVIWVDADPKIRYERITSRNRGTEDHVSFEEFLREEKTQSQYSGDANTLNLLEVKARSDIFIENDGSIEDFENEAEEKLSHFLQ